MCEQPGETISRLDGGTLRGFITCGCGEREVGISEQPNGEATLGISYEPKPDLRPASLIAGLTDK